MDGDEADAGGGEAAGAAARLTEDLILEILARLPAKSLHRFKCVSRQWFRLISHPDHRAKMAQTLAGFFYLGYSTEDEHLPNYLCFTSAGPDGQPPLIDPSALSLRPSCREQLHRVDCSNGLVLLHTWMPFPPVVHRYIVCNPATDEWTVVPYSPTRGVSSFVRLAVVVDPAASSSSSSLHFRIFEFQGSGPKGYIHSADIYSSDSGTWTHRECGWDHGAGISLRDETSGVFVGGVFHLSPIQPVLVSVDGDGNAWKTTPKPSHPDDDGFLGGPGPGFIGLSQGRLHFLNKMEYDDQKLCNWELEDNGVWVMKHTIDLRKLFTGPWSFRIGVKYSIIGIHPDCNVVYFLQGDNNTLISCAMDRREGCVIRDLGYNNFVPYVPYVPLFSVPLPIRAFEN